MVQYNKIFFIQQNIDEDKIEDMLHGPIWQDICIQQYIDEDKIKDMLHGPI